MKTLRTCCVVYKALFAKFDHDGSDSIEPAELGDALRYLGCNPLDSEIEAMIAEADGKGKSSTEHNIIRTFTESVKKKKWNVLINSTTILYYYVKCGGLVICYLLCCCL